MYQLYSYPGTYAIGAHLLLEESAVPYRIVNPRADASLTDNAFYKASPHGRVPAIIMPNGSTMCESSAIVLHLADVLSEQRFSIAADSKDRASYLQWMFYLSSTLQPDVMLIFHPENYFTDDTRQAALVASATVRLQKVWAVLEQEYQTQTNRHGGPWMFDKGPTALDFALANVMLWPECYPVSSQSSPALERMLKALSERESFIRIMPWHNGLSDEPPQRS